MTQVTPVAQYQPSWRGYILGTVAWAITCAILITGVLWSEAPRAYRAVAIIGLALIGVSIAGVVAITGGAL